MAAKKPTQENEFRWVSLDLTDKQKKDMLSVLDTDETIWTGYLRLVEEGYKVQVTWEKRGKCHACYVFQTDPDGPNNKAGLSVRGASPRAAIRGALFRHYYVFEGDWGAREGMEFDAD